MPYVASYMALIPCYQQPVNHTRLPSIPRLLVSAWSRGHFSVLGVLGLRVQGLEGVQVYRAQGVGVVMVRV